MLKLYTLLIFITCFTSLKAQDFSNQGKEFWISYSYHVGMSNGQAPTMTLYITADAATSYSVDAVGTSTTVIQSGNIAAGQVITVVVPNSYSINNEGLFSDKAIRVTSQKNVVVYSYITRSAISGATVCLPTNVLGREYYSINYTQTSNEANSNSYFTVVATEDLTSVEITPAANTKNGWTAGTTYTVNLNKGQIYQVLGTTTGNNGVDLTGSKIKSVSSGGNGCKKIAVFSGAGKIKIGSNCGNNNSSDNLYQQMYPAATWGKKYVTVPSYNRTFNYFRISKSILNSNVYLNGVLIPQGSFTNNFYYEFSNSQVNVIESDQPICVSQYFTTQGCNSNASPYDPDMIILNPVEQNINKVTLISSNLVATQPEHHIHVIIPNGGSALTSFKFDGNPVSTASWNVVPGLPSYSYLYLNNVTQGFHTLFSDTGFNAIAYGYAAAESYGYSAGANVKDLYQYATVNNTLGDTSITFAAACKNSPFSLYQRLPYKPLSITWDFSTSGLPFANYTNNNPSTILIDSVNVNGRWVYRYKNPNLYIVSNSGTYPITIIVNNPTSDGCSGIQEIDFNLEVFDQPIASFDWTHTGCATDTVYFRENATATQLGNRPVYKWRWLYHDNTTDSVKNPKKLYNAGGSFPVKLQLITDVGCLSDTLTKVINISSLPVANFTLPTPTCVGSTLSFTSTATIATGTIEKYAWNWGDGSLADTLLIPGPATHTYATAGTYNITHTVIALGGCKSLPKIIPITINVKPVANFDLPANVCLPVGAATFNNTTTITDGTLPQVTYVWNFGDASPTTTTTNGIHNYTAVGPFNVNLQATSNNGCKHDTTKIFNNIRPRPTANFTNANEICIKDSLQFTSTSVGNGGNIITYNWDFGDATTSSLANPKKKWATSGNKIVKHWIVTDQGCSSDTMTKTIYVNASPIADFNFSNLGRCAGTPIIFNNTSTFTDGVITNWRWDFGDGTPIVNAITGVSQSHPFATGGTYQVKLVVTTDKGCVSDTIIKPITITASPVASFVLPGGICLPSGFAQFTNNTTISDGTLPTVTYVWDFGDATPTSTVTNPTHNYSGVGPYNVKLTATSAIGCMDDSLQVLSTIFARPTANFTTNAEVCLNDNITFTSTSNPINGTITEYYWDNGTGAFVLGTSTSTTSFASTGTKTIRHYIKTSNGCLSDTMTKVITVNALPTANFTVSATKCEKGNITFTSTSLPNSGILTEWNWDWADGSPLQTVTNGNPLIHVFATSGTYNVKLTVKTDKGCISTVFTLPVIVNPKPIANFDLPTNVCLPVGATTFNNTTTISNGTLPQVTYVWNFGDASPTTTTTNGIHNYTAVGPFNVNLQATSNNGCIHDTTKIFNNIRPRPTASFTNALEVCVNSNITFTSTSTGNGGNITENYWDNGSGTFVLGTSTMSNTFATRGTKTIRHYIKTDQGCISDTATKTIYVNALPTPNFTFSNPQCVDKNITFTNSSTTSDGIINSWSWDFGDGSAVVTGVGPHTHSYNATNSFNVSLSVTSDKGCSNSAPIIKPVVINPNPVVKMYLPEICLNDPIAQFLDSSTIADGTESQFTYLWNFGDPNATIVNPNTSTIKNATHKYIQAANYNMWLEVTSNKGCTSRKDTVFTVNGAIPVANFAVQNAGNLCSNTDVTIQNTSTVNFGNVTYLEIYWDRTNNPLLKTIDQNPTPGKLYNYAYPPFGTPATKTFTVRMVAYSGSVTGPCLNVVTKTITVLASPNIVFSNIPEICQENAPATIIQAQETTGITGVSVFTGPGIVGNLFNPSIAGIGTHTIRYTFTGTNGCTTYKEQTITVNPTPIANAGPDVTVLEGGSVTLQGSSTSSNVTYLWTPNTSLSSTSILQPSASPANDITYTLKVTSDKGCNATDQVLVRVLKGPRVPNAFSPNGDGINDKWEIEFLDTYIGCTVEVFNIYGQKVYRSVGYGTPWDGKYNGVTLPIGTYYYIIEPKNGRAPITGYVGIIK